MTKMCITLMPIHGRKCIERPWFVKHHDGGFCDHLAYDLLSQERVSSVGDSKVRSISGAIVAWFTIETV